MNVYCMSLKTPEFVIRVFVHISWKLRLFKNMIEDIKDTQYYRRTEKLNPELLFVTYVTKLCF